MPTYQYHCNDCGNDLEVVQRFTDDALTVCPSCAGHLRKVYSAVGVVFKGSGFYATDSRSKGASSSAVPATGHHGSGSSDSSDGSSASSGTASSSDSGGTAAAVGSSSGDSAA
ncbi:FmdB family zinc ribbon protein [uncultured Propionibacterium sp.]|uniref:FmdB family zinc ribbon protein n=1 Tax=uncultured Propionibacterium sp. TaxID=218066 RepID=UPI00292FF137|nr:FmdB family zinc ribbon protein [uncultured Propionibacterium sp.]